MSEHKIKLKPFQVPNFALCTIKDATAATDEQSLSIPLADLDAKTLSEMCADFRAMAFSKAGKVDPEIKP